MSKKSNSALSLLMAICAVFILFTAINAQDDKTSKDMKDAKDVNVVNIPKVILSGTANVNIINKAPIPVSGSISLSGTPTVQLSPGSVTGISGNVGVSNTEANPLFVRQGQTTTLAFSTLNNAFPVNSGSTLLTPSGGVDVSRYAQIRVVIDPGSEPQFTYSVRLSLPGPENKKLYLDVITFDPNATNLGSITKVYDVPGTTLEVEAQVFCTPGGNPCPATVPLSVTIFGR